MVATKETLADYIKQCMVFNLIFILWIGSAMVYHVVQCYGCVVSALQYMCCVSGSSIINKLQVQVSTYLIISRCFSLVTHSLQLSLCNLFTRSTVSLSREENSSCFQGEMTRVRLYNVFKTSDRRSHDSSLSPDYVYKGQQGQVKIKVNMTCRQYDVMPIRRDVNKTWRLYEVTVDMKVSFLFYRTSE